MMTARNGLPVLTWAVVLVSVILVLQPRVEGYLGQFGGKRFINRRPTGLKEILSKVRMVVKHLLQ